jgi:hypothetical protein
MSAMSPRRSSLRRALAHHRGGRSIVLCRVGGKETFDVTLNVEISSGRIMSARMENPVTTMTRECTDTSLTHCGDPPVTPTERRIQLSLAG